MSDVNTLQIENIECLDDYKISSSSNHVIIEVTDYHDFIGNDNQFIYSDLAKKISFYESAPTWGIVVKIPQGLYFNPSSVDSMEWKTKQELELGDKVWFQRSMYLNSPRIRVEEKEYVVIRYPDIYMGHRNGAYFMINGYLLVRPLIETKKCLEYVSEEQSLVECEVILVSDPVEYLNAENEHLVVNPRDRIILADAYRITLEDDMFAEFSSEKCYVLQRREIAYIYN